MHNKKMEVCLTPALLPLYDIKDSIVVVIDIFRATSSIVYGFENGAEAIIPVASVEACLMHKDSICLLAAERDGKVVHGFDFGNSPFSYSKDKVNGKTIVLTTTNGTHAINESKNAYKIAIGSFLNLTALCQWLKSQNCNVLLLCAGWKNQFNLEDTLFAGAVVNSLKTTYSINCDSGVAAEDLYLQAKDDLREYLKKSSHSARLEKLNIEEDIQFCLKVDSCTAIPILQGDRLVKMKNSDSVIA